MKSPTHYGITWDKVAHGTWLTSDLAGWWVGCLQWSGDEWLLAVASEDPGDPAARQWSLAFDGPPPFEVASGLLTVPAFDAPWAAR